MPCALFYFSKSCKVVFDIKKEFYKYCLLLDKMIGDKKIQKMYDWIGENLKIVGV